MTSKHYDQLPSKHYDQLTDGELFSVDGGRTWHPCAVPLFGNVAVYVSDRRDDNAPTVRIAVPHDGMVLTHPGGTDTRTP